MADDAHPDFSTEELEEFKVRRIEQITFDGLVRRHECPHCGAWIGEPCHTPKWYPSAQFHVARLIAAGLRDAPPDDDE